jgi:hypothetical protein
MDAQYRTFPGSSASQANDKVVDRDRTVSFLLRKAVAFVALI